MTLPEKNIKLGGIQIAAWKNSSEKGEWNSYSIDKSYKDEKGEWKTTKTYSDHDLPNIIACLQKIMSDRLVITNPSQEVSDEPEKNNQKKG